MTQLHSRAEEIRNSELQKLSRKFPELTPEQLKEFIAVWDNDEILSEYSNVVVALAYTGMRPQEMGALTWDDVDLNNRTLDLNKVIKKDPKGSQFDSPIMKSKSASRVLAIDDELVPSLRFR